MGMLLFYIKNCAMIQSFLILDKIAEIQLHITLILLKKILKTK
jgi:hypothetical protein